MHSISSVKSLPVCRRRLSKKDPLYYLSFPFPGDAPWNIWAKNNNTCKGPRVLHPYQVSSNPFGGLCRRSWKCNKRPHIVNLSTMCHLFDGSARAPFLFTDRPEKHQLSRGRWDLALCQVSLNSVQRFQRSQKCLSQLGAGSSSCFFRSARKNTN